MRMRFRTGSVFTQRRRVAAATLTMLLAAPVAVVAGAGAAAAVPASPQLIAVRAASHDGYDRVVWEFKNGLPGTRVIRKVSTLTGDASGEPIRIAGSTILALTMYQADGHDPDTGVNTSPARLAPGLPNVVEVVKSGDFEATVTYGVGLVKDQPYRLFTLNSPPRVVLDVRTDYPKAWRSVSFLNVPNYSVGREPYTTRVLRRVPAFTPAGAVLHHLFAGPTAAERSAGLATVRSGATGFRNLSITDRVARVTLTGACNSNGATFTVASLIIPTLKQFDSVGFVKISDPAGHTERPSGHSDSIPTCLEP